MPYPRYFDEGIETMPAGEIRRRQVSRLQSQLASVYARSPFYRRTFDDAGVNPRRVRREGRYALCRPDLLLLGSAPTAASRSLSPRAPAGSWSLPTWTGSASRWYASAPATRSWCGRIPARAAGPGCGCAASPAPTTC